MSNWRIVKSHPTGVTAPAQSMNSSPSGLKETWHIYTIEDTETGGEKRVKSTSHYELGELISDLDSFDAD